MGRQNARRTRKKKGNLISDGGPSARSAPPKTDAATAQSEGAHHSLQGIGREHDHSERPKDPSTTLPKWYTTVQKQVATSIEKVPDNRVEIAAVMTLCVCLALVILQLSLMILVPEKRVSAPPPLQVRIDSNALSSLPVKVGLVASCGCWAAPDGDAAKKFKFGLQNNWTEPLNIGGGKQSAVRLLVAYSNGFKPQQTIDTSDGKRLINVAMPPDVSMYESTGQEQVAPLYVDDDADLFKLPKNYELWGLVPNHNFVVRLYEKASNSTSGNAGFGTVVDREILDPGKTFNDSKLGHGSWVFEVPLPLDVRKATQYEDMMPLDSNFNPLIPTDYEAIEKSMIIVGVGIFSGASVGGLIGFAPAPPHGFLQDPHSF